jgi:hypothetical protein
LLRWAKRDSFCEAQFSSLPFILGLALAAANRGRLDSKPPKYQNWYRRFADSLFEGLVSVHYKFFGRRPQSYDGDNLPEGRGVLWAHEILTIAAKNIDACLIQLDPDPYEWRRRAICLVKQVSQLQKATIADRLDKANIAYRAEPIEKADEFRI